jgi:ketose-bisphosphate aldolase
LPLHKRPSNLVTLAEVLPAAERGGYAVGSFAPRTSVLIRPVLRAAQALRSPVIVQISENEFKWFDLTPARFADEFYAALADEHITVPVVLHLDHTRSIPPIHDAMDAGFTSVMIDASERSLAENIAMTAEVTAFAHPAGVTVEGELGRIGTGDFIETDRDEELYTDPDEAGQFVAQTGVDALAVSVGTAHGVYMVRQPKIDYDRLCAIRQRTPVPLVLHGGSGVPAEMMQRAIRLECGPVSKVNIATDLELASLAALGREKRLTDAEYRALPPAELARAAAAVEQTVADKIEHFLGSGGHADDDRT